MFSCSFYDRRNHKCKKLLELTVFFGRLGSADVKAARKSLMKLTPGREEWEWVGKGKLLCHISDIYGLHICIRGLRHRLNSLYSWIFLLLNDNRVIFSQLFVYWVKMVCCHWSQMQFAQFSTEKITFLKMLNLARS